LLKTFEVTELPVRVCKFIPRKNWLVTGADDMQIRVYNYNTHEKVAVFEAHTDYIRHVAVHPSQPYLLSCSDDMMVKLWDWDQGWKNLQVFEGHSHYVMQVAFNPKDSNTFASASLDRTIKVAFPSPSPLPPLSLPSPSPLKCENRFGIWGPQFPILPLKGTKRESTASATLEAATNLISSLALMIS